MLHICLAWLCRPKSLILPQKNSLNAVLMVFETPCLSPNHPQTSDKVNFHLSFPPFVQMPVRGYLARKCLFSRPLNILILIYPIRRKGLMFLEWWFKKLIRQCNRTWAVRYKGHIVLNLRAYVWTQPKSSQRFESQWLMHLILAGVSRFHRKASVKVQIRGRQSRPTFRRGNVSLLTKPIAKRGVFHRSCVKPT